MHAATFPVLLLRKPSSSTLDHDLTTSFATAISSTQSTVIFNPCKRVTFSNSGHGRRSSGIRAKVESGGSGAADASSIAGAPPAQENFSLSNLRPWSSLIFGSVVFFSAVPIYRRMKFAQERLEKKLEVVAETVEKAAENTDKIAGELTEKLPAGKLKQVALQVEKIAEAVDKEAEVARELIEKVDELTDKLQQAIVEDKIRVNRDSN